MIQRRVELGHSSGSTEELLPIFLSLYLFFWGVNTMVTKVVAWRMDSVAVVVRDAADSAEIDLFES